MSLYLRAILTALIAALAAQGGWLGAIAALIQEFLLPLLGSEKLDLPEGTDIKSDKAPEDFKAGVRKMLQDLISKVQRPLIRIILTRIVGQLSDALLDTVWGIVTGTQSFPTANVAAGSSEDADLAAASLEDVKGNAEKLGVRSDNMASMIQPAAAPKK